MNRGHENRWLTLLRGRLPECDAWRTDWGRLQGIPKTRQAFQRFGVDGEPAGRGVQELGMAENSVILAKARVLKRLREEAGDLLV
ncbi:MAG: hypothetical protein ACLQIB_08170 [Isosphaeraceae bacterium]